MTTESRTTGSVAASLMKVRKEFQAERTIKIAARATVKDGKIVKDCKEVVNRVWELARYETDGDTEEIAERREKIINEQVVRFLSDIKTKRVGEMDAQQVQYLFAVVQHLKEMGR
jgi:hypothetical protein